MKRFSGIDTLDVAMSNSLGVCRVKSLGDFDGRRQELISGQRPAHNAIAQRFTLTRAQVEPCQGQLWKGRNPPRTVPAGRCKRYGRRAILKQAAFPTELLVLWLALYWRKSVVEFRDSSGTQAQIPDYLLACFSSSDKYCFTMATSSGLLAYFRYSRSCVASFAESPFAS